MEREIFDICSFGGNAKVEYQGADRRVVSVNFKEALSGLKETCLGSDEGDVEWVRCESVVLLNNRTVA